MPVFSCCLLYGTRSLKRAVRDFISSGVGVTVFTGGPPSVFACGFEAAKVCGLASVSGRNDFVSLPSFTIVTLIKDRIYVNKNVSILSSWQKIVRANV